MDVYPRLLSARVSLGVTGAMRMFCGRGRLHLPWKFEIFECMQVVVACRLIAMDPLYILI